MSADEILPGGWEKRISRSTGILLSIILRNMKL